MSKFLFQIKLTDTSHGDIGLGGVKHNTGLHCMTHFVDSVYHMMVIFLFFFL